MSNKNKLCWLMVTILCLTSLNIFSEEKPAERVLWDKRPIAVGVSVSNERIIHFPTEIRYWVPLSISDKVSFVAANGVLYLTSHKAFQKTRIRVQSLETQKMYLLDLTSHESGDFSQELIVLDREYIENKSQDIKKVKKTDDWFVRLTRFASQSLYASERLMPSDVEIRRININSSDPIPLVAGGDIEAIPIYSWTGGGIYVTAVRLRNLSNDYIAISHDVPTVIQLIERTLILRTDIRGDWLAATPQHTYLEPSGKPKDRTTLYLISKNHFMESFL